MSTSQAILLMVDSALGIYIPKHFIEIASDKWDHISDEDREILTEGPEHELYWDAWSCVMTNATCTTRDGTYRLEQDNDLWAVCEELMTDDEYEDFYGEGRL